MLHADTAESQLPSPERLKDECTAQPCSQYEQTNPRRVPFFRRQAPIRPDLAVLLTYHYSISSTGLFRANTPSNGVCPALFSSLHRASESRTVAPYTMRRKTRSLLSTITGDLCTGALASHRLCAAELQSSVAVGKQHQQCPIRPYAMLPADRYFADRGHVIRPTVLTRAEGAT
jgi:hypothetical protein